MTSGGMKTAPNKRPYICIPKKLIDLLAEQYELEHGLLVEDLNPYINEGYIQAYFREWGTVKSCKIRKNPNSGKQKSLAFVKFSCEEEADMADWVGPHNIGGTEVKMRRFVTFKGEEDSEQGVDGATVKPRPRPSMGLGYLLEDAQWLDEDE
ncbi:heterogeneous nuclear ribonucleoprotein A2 homolog 1 [Astatotilapia calliptera]|uniref:RRM domain-containing protein n=1 Tax=Astatotilapia calliptera TaxID=8154 RepID=A0A3P8R7G4_ASTCA|nr:heterogeneous nuclear ribonucleoprotein A2 homolog 1-like [Astatotilapia calliptera]